MHSILATRNLNCVIRTQDVRKGNLLYAIRKRHSDIINIYNDNALWLHTDLYKCIIDLHNKQINYTNNGYR